MDERPTTPDVGAEAGEDEHDRPTVPAWCAAKIRELEQQLDRLYSGRACRACTGTGEEIKHGRAGSYARACADCDGSGTVSRRGP